MTNKANNDIIAKYEIKRDVAQFGRAPRSGRGSRKFESCHLDQKTRGCLYGTLLFFINMAVMRNCITQSEFARIELIVQNLVISSKTKKRV